MPTSSACNKLRRSSAREPGAFCFVPKLTISHECFVPKQCSRAKVLRAIRTFRYLDII